MKNTFWTKIVPTAGCHISDAIEGVLRLNNLTDDKFYLSFNGYELYIDGTKSLGELLQEWSELSNRKREESKSLLPQTQEKI